VYDYWTRRDDSVSVRGVMDVDEGYVIHEYEVIHNNKVSVMCFISERYNSDKINEKLLHMIENKGDILMERYKFVNCSIVNSSGECIMDITDDMRAFMFYFRDHDKYVCNMSYVIKYLLLKYESLRGIDMTGCRILFYMNDDEFTERVVELGDTDIMLHNVINVKN